MDLSLSESLSPLAAAQAAEAPAAAPLTGKPMTLGGHAAPSYSSTGDSLASMAGSLVLVLAMIFALAWLMRRVQGIRNPQGSTLRIESGLQVGAKERVVVLQAGDARLLLGVTAGQITLLHRLGERAPVDTVDAEPATPSNPTFQQAFGDQLHKLLGRK